MIKKEVKGTLDKISDILLSLSAAAICFFVAWTIWVADSGYPYLMKNTAWHIKNQFWDGWTPFYVALSFLATFFLIFFAAVGISFVESIFMNEANHDDNNVIE